MIALAMVRRALPFLLIAAITAGSTTKPDTETRKPTMVLCVYPVGGDGVTPDCGDPEVEAQMRARMLSPDQARKAGCPPILPRVSATGKTLMMQPTFTDEPPRPTPEPRAVDPAVAARVNAAWDRIDGWLGAHASATLRELRFPATAAQLASLERTHKLPDDLYASLRRHNGSDDNGFPLPASFSLGGAAEIQDLAMLLCDGLVREGPAEAADPERGRWHGSLVPFGTTARGQELFVNPRDGRVGVHEWNKAITYDGPMAWPTYTALLEAVATALEGGGPLRAWYPSVTAGCELRWVTSRPGPLPGNCAGGPRQSPTPKPSPSPTETKLTRERARAIGCAPARRTPEYRVVGGKVARDVGAVWRRIERWLAREAPVTYRGLPGPASAEAIARTEARMGQRWPEALRASLLRHDGGGEAYGLGPDGLHTLSPVTVIHDEWKVTCDIAVELGDDSLTWWDGHLVPFAAANDGGDLVVDPRTGKVGQYFNETGLTFTGPDAWPSYLAVLRDLARALETGKPLRGARPVVTKGRLEWKTVR